MGMRTEEIRMDEIRITGRIRKDEGDLEGLADSIRERGLINPITVMELSEGGYLLLAGERRVSAAERIGWTSIRTTVVAAVDAEEQLRIEIAENEERKEFTISEQLEYAAKLKEIESEKARQRMSIYGKSGRETQLGEIPMEESGGSVVRHYPQKGKTADIVAKKAGLGSEAQMRRAQVIADQRPDLLEKIDKGEATIYGTYCEITGYNRVKKKEPYEQMENTFPAPEIPEMPEPMTAMPAPDEPDESEQEFLMSMPEPEADDAASAQEDSGKSERAETLARSRRKVVSWERPDLMELVEEGVISLDTAYYRTLKARKEAKEEYAQYEGIPKLPGEVMKARLTPEERRRAKEIEATMVHTQEFTIETEIPDMFRPSDYDTHERLMEEPLYAELYEHDRKLQGVANLMRGELVTKCENYEKRIRSYEENVQSMKQMISHLREQLSETLAGNPEESEDEDL